MSAAELAAARAERAARYAAQQASAAASEPPPPPPVDAALAEGAGDSGGGGGTTLRGRESAVPRDAAEDAVLACIELSGERDRRGTHKATEVDCRLWESAWRPSAAGSRVFTLNRGEGRLHDVRSETEAERVRNIRFLTESARLIQQARARGECVWVHCTEGINRGPAGLMAYLLLHTEVPSLTAVFKVVKRVRAKARTRSNTFATELETICRSAGKPLE